MYGPNIQSKIAPNNVYPSQSTKPERNSISNVAFNVHDACNSPAVLIAAVTFNRALVTQVPRVTISPSTAAEVFTPKSHAEIRGAVDACTQGQNHGHLWLSSN